MGHATATRAASGPRTAASTTSQSAQVRDEWKGAALSVKQSQVEVLFSCTYLNYAIPAGDNLSHEITRTLAKDRLSNRR